MTYDTDSVLVTAAFPGDANLSGGVTLADFTTLAATFGTNGTWVNGNFNGDASIPLADFTLLAANFGTSVPADPPRSSTGLTGAGSAVPEASTLAIAPCGFALGAVRRRRVAR